MMAVANTGVYAVGSAFKSLDGSMVAGAKMWTDTGGSIWCGAAPLRAAGTPCTTAGAVGRGGGLGQNRCRELVCE